jgi:hypothetical protein
MDVYLVRHKNGKTKVFVVDGLQAFLCHDGRVVHVEQLPKTGIARSWTQYISLSEDTDVAVKARQAVLNSRLKKEIAQELSQPIAETRRNQNIRKANAQKLRPAQLCVGDFLRVPHLRSHVLAKVVSISRHSYPQSFSQTKHLDAEEKTRRALDEGICKTG